MNRISRIKRRAPNHVSCSPLADTFFLILFQSMQSNRRHPSGNGDIEKAEGKFETLRLDVPREPGHLDSVDEEKEVESRDQDIDPERPVSLYPDRQLSAKGLADDLLLVPDHQAHAGKRHPDQEDPGNLIRPFHGGPQDVAKDDLHDKDEKTAHDEEKGVVFLKSISSFIRHSG